MGNRFKEILQGRPVILVVASSSHQPGPEGDPRTWTLAHWQGDRWRFTEVTTSTHNYDTGSLHIDGDDWRIIGPTETGPQAFNPGGEVAMWVSKDQGVSWKMAKQLTEKSEFNHTYCRRPLNAHPDFYALWPNGQAGGFLK